MIFGIILLITGFFILLIFIAKKAVFLNP